MIKTVTIILSVAGSGLGIWTVCTSSTPAPAIPPDAPPAVNPYELGIAATGIVEAASRNVRVASPEAALVQCVFVDVGDPVRQGDPLFQVDTRLIAAEQAQLRAAVEVARQRLQRLQAGPRDEDVAPLRSAVERAAAELAAAEDRFNRTKELHGRGAAGQALLTEAQLAVRRAEAVVSETQGELDRILAGTWDRDINVAESELAKAEADLQVIEARLQRCTIRSPIDGTVLKRYVEPGEFAPANATALVVGNIARLHVRAQVDENDAPRLRRGAVAVVTIPGTGRQCGLRMLRIEPLAIPKSQLTASDFEVVENRVIEVIFEAEAGAESLCPGQAVDVFIETIDASPQGTFK